MVEAGLAEGVVGRARSAGLLDIVRPRPARLHDRPASRRGRRAVRRRAGDGDEARAAVRGARRRFARGAGAPDAVVLTVAAGPAVHAGRGAAAGGAAASSCCCAADTKGSTSGCASASATEELSIGDYVLTGGELPALVVDRRGRPAGAGRGRRRAVGGRGFVHPRAAGLPALHAAGGVSRARRCPTCCCRGTTREIRRWRRTEALQRTLERRPELLDDAALDDEERAMLRESNSRVHEAEKERVT